MKSVINNKDKLKIKDIVSKCFQQLFNFTFGGVSISFAFGPIIQSTCP